eukprot:TRINITY_DN5236_c0_g1_i2.p1 TRINITY_DN5236_c0_g1~~TRINITY_DN5236_c0_g1_i2.p1  ORF type:complete len:274 (-),score=40.31 TRINITY_DN5236_c0_g1_i2:5-736(-)
MGLQMDSEEAKKKKGKHGFKEIDEGANKGKMSIFVTFGILCCVVLVTYFSMSDSYECGASNQTESSCEEFRHLINCRTTVATPLNVEINSIMGGTETNYRAQCAWDAALSEVRLAFIFASIVVVYIGYSAYKEENKKKAEIFMYSAMFLAMMLLVAAFFDSVEIMDSKDDNENLCNLRGKYASPPEMKLKSYGCYYTKYYLTVILTVSSAISLIVSAYHINQWKLFLPNVPDQLQSCYICSNS